MEIKLTGNEDAREIFRLRTAGDKVFLVSRKTLLRLIERFVGGEVDAKQVEGYADAVEVMDDVENEDGYEELIATILFQLSSPEINGSLTPDEVERILGLLRK